MASLSRAPTLLFLLLSLLSYPLTFALNADGSLLLSFKYTILDDPNAVLSDWNYSDDTPCSWNGVMCMNFQETTTSSRVISLFLPNCRLLGSVPSDLGLIEHLRHVDLSGNSLNGTLPDSLFNASELRVLSLASNDISGELPFVSPSMISLRFVNLSDNAFTGRIPASLSSLPNLTTLSLSNNYFSGELSEGVFGRIEVLDLSSNLLNGSLMATTNGGSSLRYLNLSSNQLTGPIPPELGSTIPANATVDLSFNKLTGKIPEYGAFQSQNPKNFVGNQDLCGEPLMVPCPIPSPPSNPLPPPPSTSPPAIAVIPKTSDGNASTGAGRGGKLSLAAIAAIIVGDVAGIGLLFSVLLCVYQSKRRKRQLLEQRGAAPDKKTRTEAVMSSSGTGEFGAFSCCLRNKCGCCDGGEGDTSESTGSSETEADEADKRKKQEEVTFVTFDGDMELELETLLKASAYILGVAGPSIVYKAVLEDGTALAVRRIGESGSAGKVKDFEAQVRSIAKLRHPNLLPLRGFYWAADEKLIISDYAPNGSLANVSFTKKLGSSPFHLSWDARMRVLRGVARGVAFLHEKKCVHGNLKPSNILLSTDMEPWVADFGLERLVFGNKSGRPGTSARNFGSKRSVMSQGSLPDLSPNLGAGPSPGFMSLYQAPESLQNLKPNAKWDVFSFGTILLELIAGRMFSEAEVAEWNAGFVEEGNRILRMVDSAIRGEVQGKEEALLCCFKLGFCCTSVDPQRRPSMKEALQVLERTLSSTSLP